MTSVSATDLMAALDQISRDSVVQFINWVAYFGDPDGVREGGRARGGRREGGLK
jgi:hypothetical protein